MIGDHMLRRLASICLFAFAGSASAVVTYDFTESGGNVVGTLSGSIDTSGLSLGLATITSLGINLNPGILLSGSLGLASTTITVNEQLFGSGPPRLADSSTGDRFGVSSNLVYLPVGYVSGTALFGNDDTSWRNLC